MNQRAGSQPTPNLPCLGLPMLQSWEKPPPAVQASRLRHSWCRGPSEDTSQPRNVHGHCWGTRSQRDSGREAAQGLCPSPCRTLSRLPATEQGLPGGRRGEAACSLSLSRSRAGCPTAEAEEYAAPGRVEGLHRAVRKVLPEQQALRGGSFQVSHCYRTTLFSVGLAQRSVLRLLQVSQTSAPFH